MTDAKKKIEELLEKNSYNFEDLRDLVSVLRSDVGCPWDREQDHKSIRNDLIEETYEVIEAFAVLPFTDICSVSHASLATVLLLINLETFRYLSSLISSPLQKRTALMRRPFNML